MKKIRKQAIMLTLTLAFIFIFSGTVSATDWTVGPNASYNYTSIQAAVDGSSDNDTITVYSNGTDAYTENIVVNKTGLNIKANGTVTVQPTNPIKFIFNIDSKGNNSIIQGFYLRGGGYENSYYGIGLTGTDGCKILNNNILNANYAIHASNCTNLIIDGNNISNSYDLGIYVLNTPGTSNNKVTNNVLADNREGISLYSINGVEVSRNTIQNSGLTGLDLYFSSNNLISGNTITGTKIAPGMYYSNGDGMFISSVSRYNVISGNIISGNANNGIHFWYYCNNNNITGNNITNNRNGINLDYLVMLGSSVGDSYNTISGNNISSNTQDGIIIGTNSEYNTASNNAISNNHRGIYIENTQENYIIGNSILSNIYVGTYLQNATSNIISENTFKGNPYGIMLWAVSNSNSISGNTINSTLNGIHVESSSSNTFIRNSINSTASQGIYMYGSSDNGIFLSNITALSNGIGLWSCGNIQILYNNIIAGTGIWLFGDPYANNVAHFNRIIATGQLVMGYPGLFDATLNWWGSNNNPGSRITGNVDYNPWIYMTIVADPNTINNGETSLITASFNNQFDGEIITTLDPLLGHIPDKIPVIFNTDLGSIGCKTIEKQITNGIATATLTADETAGTAHINATTDSQTVNTEVIIKPKSSLYLTVTPGKINPVAGDTVVYTLKVGNKGPDTAKNVVMTYVIPAGLEFAGATVDAGNYTYDPATRTITWNIGDVPKGDPYMWLSLNIAQAGQYLINPVIRTSSYDPTLNSNIQSITVNAVQAKSSVKAASKTIGMLNTGIPIPLLILGILAFFGGFVTPRRK